MLVRYLFPAAASHLPLMWLCTTFLDVVRTSYSDPSGLGQDTVWLPDCFQVFCKTSSAPPSCSVCVCAFPASHIVEHTPANVNKHALVKLLTHSYLQMNVYLLIQPKEIHNIPMHTPAPSIDHHIGCPRATSFSHVAIGMQSGCGVTLSFTSARRPSY